MEESEKKAGPGFVGEIRDVWCAACCRYLTAGEGLILGRGSSQFDFLYCKEHGALAWMKRGGEVGGGAATLSEVEKAGLEYARARVLVRKAEILHSGCHTALGEATMKQGQAWQAFLAQLNKMEG